MCVCKEEITEISLKAQTFVHCTYIKSKKQLMVTDTQGIGYTLCDPEIATVRQIDPADQSIYFCTGDLSTDAIEPFFEKHERNMYCKLLKLPEIHKVLYMSMANNATIHFLNCFVFDKSMEPNDLDEDLTSYTAYE